jgi:hypothetical protein
MTPTTVTQTPEAQRNGSVLRVWTGVEVGELEAAVCDAFTLNDLRRLVRIGLEQDLEYLVNLNGNKADVVSDLVAEVKRAGWTEQFIRAVYNARPQNPLVRKFCNDRATFVFQPPPAAEQLGRSVASGLAAFQVLIGRPDAAPLRELLHQLSNRFSESRQAIVQMRQYKVLHDCLHTVAYSLIDELSRSVERFREDASRFRGVTNDSRQLRRYTGDLERWARDARTVADGPPPDPPIPFREVEDGWIANLITAVECLRRALNAVDPAPASDGLNLVKWVLSQQPARINNELVRRAGDFQFRQLSQDLRRAAGFVPADDSRAGLFAVGLADLDALQPRLHSLVAEHGHWQSLENNLALIGQTPGLLSIMWPVLREAGRQIADLYQSTEWAARLSAAIQQYDLVQDPEGRWFALDDFRRESDARFFAVDRDLRTLCDTLATVAAAVDAVLEAISHEH